MHQKGCYKGWKMLVLGLLVLANDMYQFMTWWSFVGAIIALKGLLHLVFPDKFQVKKK